MDTWTIAIICIIVMIVVCVVALLIFLICWCRLKIVDDTNVRKRVLVANSQGYAQQEIKTNIVQQPIVVPAPVPVPLPRREIVRPMTPPPPPQPEIVVHEVVHRYEPEPPPVILPALPAPEPQRLVRRSSWSEGHHHRHHHHGGNDEWIMIKKKKKNGGRRRVEEDSSSDDDDDYPRNRRQINIVSPRLNAYDLAMPAMPAMVQAVPFQPMAQAVPIQPMALGAGVGAATYITGRPVAAVPMMAAGASTFQPTYGVLPRM